MLAAADRLEFEKAAALRDQIQSMEQYIGQKTSVSELEKNHGNSGRSRRRRNSRSSMAQRIPKPERG